MAEPISVRNAYELSLLTEIAYYNTTSGQATGLSVTDNFLSSQVQQALTESTYRRLVAQDKLGSSATESEINAEVAAAAQRAGEALYNSFDGIVSVQNSMSGDNGTGVDLFIAKRRGQNKYVLSIDGTAFTGGGPGETLQDVYANIENALNLIGVTGSFSISDLPDSALGAQVLQAKAFVEDFVQNNPGVSLSDIDITGHSLGGLVTILLKAELGDQIGTATAMSPPGGGGGWFSCVNPDHCRAILWRGFIKSFCG